LKSKSQRHPRLYINVLKKINDKSYNIEYYENQYSSNGSLQITSGSISTNLLPKTNSNQKNLYDLNKSEFQLLINLIKKQEKASKVYLNKKKLDQLNVINSSLELLFEYKKIFLTWFSKNEIL